MQRGTFIAATAAAPFAISLAATAEPDLKTYPGSDEEVLERLALFEEWTGTKAPCSPVPEITE